MVSDLVKKYHSVRLFSQGMFPCRDIPASIAQRFCLFVALTCSCVIQQYHSHGTSLADTERSEYSLKLYVLVGDVKKQNDEGPSPSIYT